MSNNFPSVKVLSHDSSLDNLSFSSGEAQNNKEKKGDSLEVTTQHLTNDEIRKDLMFAKKNSGSKSNSFVESD